MFVKTFKIQTTNFTSKSCNDIKHSDTCRHGESITFMLVRWRINILCLPEILVDFLKCIVTVKPLLIKITMDYMEHIPCTCISRGGYDSDCMVVGFTSTNIISIKVWSLISVYGEEYLIQNYVKVCRWHLEVRWFSLGTM